MVSHHTHRSEIEPGRPSKTALALSILFAGCHTEDRRDPVGTIAVVLVLVLLVIVLESWEDNRRRRKLGKPPRKLFRYWWSGM